MIGFDPFAYSVVVTKTIEDGEECFFSYVSELPDISSFGDSYEESYENCIDSLTVLFEEANAHKKEFPAPFKTLDIAGFSGRVTLRMSRSMHGDIVRCANEDGVSLNQWVIEAIAQRRGYYVGAKSSVPSASTIFSTALAPLLKGVFSQANTIHQTASRGLMLPSTEAKFVPLGAQPQFD